MLLKPFIFSYVLECLLTCLVCLLPCSHSLRPLRMLHSVGNIVQCMASVVPHARNVYIYTYFWLHGHTRKAQQQQQQPPSQQQRRQVFWLQVRSQADTHSYRVDRTQLISFWVITFLIYAFWFSFFFLVLCVVGLHSRVFILFTLCLAITMHRISSCAVFGANLIKTPWTHLIQCACVCVHSDSIRFQFDFP